MITKISNMTIREIIKRQNDLLVSDYDIELIAKNERKKVYKEIQEIIDTMSNPMYWIDKMIKENK